MGRLQSVRYGKLFACVLACAGMVLALSGCVYSSTITEIVHMQDDALEIDYDADPIYVNSVEASMVSNQLPALVPIDDGMQRMLEGYPEFEGDLSNEDVQTSYDGIEEFMSEVESSRNGSNWDAGDGSEEDELLSSGRRSRIDRSWISGVAARTHEVAVEHVASGNASNTGKESNKGDSVDSKGGAGSGGSAGGGTEGQTSGGGASKGDDNSGRQGDDPNAASHSGRNPGSTFSDVGAVTDVPEGVKTVAAVGNAAIVCASLGGADGDANLIAADESLLTGNASTYLAGRSIGSAQIAWSGNGTLAGQANVDMLVNLEPDAVLVMQGEAAGIEPAIDALSAAGSHIVYVPDMKSPENAKLCVQRIAAMLAKGGDTQAQSVADGYVSFIDEVQSSYSGQSVLQYTIYVSRWVTEASYHGPYASRVAVNGVAFAPAGSASQPIGTYLDWAGVVNTPTYKVPYTQASSDAIVWPLKGGTKDDEWSGISGVNAGLYSTDSSYSVALTQIAPYNNAEVYFLGNPRFHCMLVANSAVSAGVSGARGANGVYAGGDAESSIVSNDYTVLVNGHGAFSSWADGSMESVLETPWAYKMICCENQDDGGSCDSYISRFYSQFYGYDGVDCVAIENGSYAG